MSTNIEVDWTAVTAALTDAFATSKDPYETAATFLFGARTDNQRELLKRVISHVREAIEVAEVPPSKATLERGDRVYVLMDQTGPVLVSNSQTVIMEKFGTVGAQAANTTKAAYYYVAVNTAWEEES